MPTTFISFVYGGILGVLAASLLEPLFIHRIDFGSTIEVGLIEEFAKILAVIIIAYRIKEKSEMNGLILGAAVGMGFAALESTGYAFTAFIQSGGSLTQTVFVTTIRGILSPVGHGTWTAILASMLFKESRDGRFRIDLSIVGTYVLVSLLHGLWDGLPPVITAYLGPGLDVFVGQAIIGIAGLFILWLRWRDARRQQIEPLQ
jgi:RsiW-degrading membrane proteinase PrsW (M82 family)